MRKLKYLSKRILILWLIMFIYCVFDVIYKIKLVNHDYISIFSVLYSIICIIVFVSIGYFKIYKPYLKIEKMMFRFSDGYSNLNSVDDIFLTVASEKCITKMDNFLHSPELLDINKRQAQYLALQNQINPHFLYNTLESIRSEAVIVGLDSVSDMTESLATFFRYTISKVENLASVEEELENCKTYFHIQEYRFGDRLKLEVIYDNEDWQFIKNLRIPKLTLQPILENSIIHGTELKLGTSTLKIKFICTENRLLIKISDDGVGMDKETLARISKSFQGNDQRSGTGKGGIALANVNNRIHLLFGDEYGMHMYSQKGYGTAVEISIPAITSDEHIRNRGVLQ